VTRRCYHDSYAASAWYALLIAAHRAAGTFSESIDAFMVPDDFMAQKLVQGGLPAEKMFRNANPFFLPDRVPDARHEGHVLYVGRLTRPKGVMTAIEAMRHVATDARLVVVGQGELEHEIIRTIAEEKLADKVSFVGPKWGDELDALLSTALAVVIPSEWYDNLPQVLCQANAAGKPVLASRINGIPEYVDEGVSGHLFAPGDRRALAALIDRVFALSANDYAALSRSSRAHAERRFDYSVHYERLSGVIETLIHKAGDGRH
jgi:glycosyltransferase involved in cell wall biosynthesis